MNWNKIISVAMTVLIFAACTKKDNMSVPLQKTQEMQKSEGGASGLMLVLYTGKVIDAEDKQPLAGVDVLRKSGMTGTATDSAGEFRIGLDYLQIIVISSNGYLSQELTAGSNSNLGTIELVRNP